MTIKININRTDPENWSLPVEDPVLDLRLLPGNDAGVTTVREYLAKLLELVWQDGEGFSGKRPFGNSGWEDDLEIPLVRAGLVNGELDEDGFIKDLDSQEAGRVISEAIKGCAVLHEFTRAARTPGGAAAPGQEAPEGRPGARRAAGADPHRQQGSPRQGRRGGRDRERDQARDQDVPAVAVREPRGRTRRLRHRGRPARQVPRLHHDPEEGLPAGHGEVQGRAVRAVRAVRQAHHPNLGAARGQYEQEKAWLSRTR